MGKLEIEGLAKRKVKCDIAIIHITFTALGTNAHELSRKVMDECDDFLKCLFKTSVKPENVEYETDRISSSYNNKNELESERKIIIRAPFDMHLINSVQTILKKGKYNYTLHVDGDISYRHRLLTELSQEALNNAKDIAYKLAEDQDKMIIGLESIRKDGWDDEEDGRYCQSAGDWGCGDICGFDDIGRPSDDIEAKYISEEVRMKVTWNIA